MDQTTMCNVKGVTHGDEPIEKYHLTPQVLVSFNLLFWFYGPQLYCLDSVPTLKMLY